MSTESIIRQAEHLAHVLVGAEEALARRDEAQATSAPAGTVSSLTATLNAQDAAVVSLTSQLETAAGAAAELATAFAQAQADVIRQRTQYDRFVMNAASPAAQAQLQALITAEATRNAARAALAAAT